MTNRQLGIIALAGAPALLVGVYLESINKSLEDSQFTGIYGIVYITAWMCSLYVLYRVNAAGTGFGKWLMRVMFFTLTLANISNIVQILTPHNDPWYFFYIDLCWPLSNILMLVLGITILIKKVMRGPARIIPFGAGLWLPVAIILMVSFGITPAITFIHGLYSAMMWSLMALVAMKQEETNEKIEINDLQMVST